MYGTSTSSATNPQDNRAAQEQGEGRGNERAPGCRAAYDTLPLAQRTGEQSGPRPGGRR